MRSSPVALTGSTGSKTRTGNVDIGRDTGAGRRETEKERQVLSRERTNNSKVGFGVW
jgi:hypothetical protein